MISNTSALIRNKERLRDYLSHGGSIWGYSCRSDTLWHETARLDDFEAARILVEYGIPVDIYTYAGDPAAMVTFMLDHGADVDSHNGDFRITMLHRLIKYFDDRDMIRLYMSRGARLTRDILDDPYEDGEMGRWRMEAMLIIQQGMDVPGACSRLRLMRGFPLARLLGSYLPTD